MGICMGMYTVRDCMDTVLNFHIHEFSENGERPLVN